MDAPGVWLVVVYVRSGEWMRKQEHRFPLWTTASGFVAAQVLKGNAVEVSLI